MFNQLDETKRAAIQKARNGRIFCDMWCTKKDCITLCITKTLLNLQKANVSLETINANLDSLEEDLRPRPFDTWFACVEYGARYEPFLEWLQTLSEQRTEGDIIYDGLSDVFKNAMGTAERTTRMCTREFTGFAPSKDKCFCDGSLCHALQLLRLFKRLDDTNFSIGTINWLLHTNFPSWNDFAAHCSRDPTTILRVSSMLSTTKREEKKEAPGTLVCVDLIRDIIRWEPSTYSCGWYVLIHIIGDPLSNGNEDRSSVMQSLLDVCTIHEDDTKNVLIRSNLRKLLDEIK